MHARNLERHLVREITREIACMTKFRPQREVDFHGVVFLRTDVYERLQDLTPDLAPALIGVQDSFEYMGAIGTPIPCFTMFRG